VLISSIENKKVVWFAKTNQYVVVEPQVAEVLQRLYANIPPQEIAVFLKEDLPVPLELLQKFVEDIQVGVYKPNTKALISKGLQVKEISSIHYQYEIHYKLGSKIIAIKYQTIKEHALIHPKIEHLAFNTRGKPSAVFEIFQKKDRVFFVLDNLIIGSWTQNNVHYLQGKVAMKLVEVLHGLSEKEWMGVFHASALKKGDKSALFFGDSGNGKSTSLALLTAHGFDLLADDFVPVTQKKKVCGFPVGISVKQGSVKILEPFYPALKHAKEVFMPNVNKTVRFIQPTNVDLETHYNCKTFIFIKYDLKEECLVKPVSKLKAFEELLPDSWVSNLPENVTSFLDWFNQATCYRIIYSNNQKMIESVHKIFNNEF